MKLSRDLTTPHYAYSYHEICPSTVLRRRYRIRSNLNSYFLMLLLSNSPTRLYLMGPSPALSASEMCRIELGEKPMSDAQNESTDTGFLPPISKPTCLGTPYVGPHPSIP